MSRVWCADDHGTMRGLVAVTLALTLVGSVLPAVAQSRDPKPATDSTQSTIGPRTVTGKVKMTTDNGFVVVGHETGQKDREWAFVLDGATRVNADGKVKAARELKEGDPVTVTYTNRDGKIVAQSVKVSPK